MDNFTGDEYHPQTVVSVWCTQFYRITPDRKLSTRAVAAKKMEVLWELVDEKWIQSWQTGLQKGMHNSKHINQQVTKQIEFQQDRRLRQQHMEEVEWYQ